MTSGVIRVTSPDATEVLADLREQYEQGELDHDRIAGEDGFVEWLARRLHSAQAQLKEYEQLFDLQWSRSQQAIALWQAESPAERANTWPDLGKLLEWLIERGNSEVPEPCQPIGCDNGYHLPGCAFAEVDAEEGGHSHA